MHQPFCMFALEGPGGSETIHAKVADVNEKVTSICRYLYIDSSPHPSLLLPQIIHFLFPHTLLSAALR